MKNKYPKVYINSQGLSENRYVIDGKAWSAAGLVQYCKDKKYPIFDLPLAGVSLDNMPWQISDTKSFIYHLKRANKVNLNYPIILDDKGYICDGWHRIVKAIELGKTSIKAIRIQEMPQPDGFED